MRGTRQPTLDTQPRRIQRRRLKGWRAPAGAIYVGRGTRWGNPNQLARTDTGWSVTHDSGSTVSSFHSDTEARRFATDAYRVHLQMHPKLAERARAELAGRDLMCWCPPPEPGKPDHCHAAVLLELANQAACEKCGTAFDPTDTRFDGRARHGETPYCHRCIDRCHESTDAFHVCAACRTTEQP